MKVITKTILLVFIATLGMVSASSGQTVTYEYDELNRLIRVVYDETTSIEYTYDAVGNRSRRVSTLLADTSINGKVNFKDYAILASRWLEEGCDYPDWCDRADVDWSTEVNWDDVAILADLWLQEIGP